METELYYFSGTGNSLFIAREVQKRIPGSKLIPIVRLLKQDRIISKAGAVGIVFPAHALSVPIAVRKFLRKLDLSGAQYVFAVASRFGTVFHGFSLVDRMLRRKGKRLNAHFIIDMPNSDTRHGVYVEPSKEEMMACERAAIARIEAGVQIIMDRGSHSEDVKNHWIQSASNPVSALFVDRFVLAAFAVSEYIGGVNYFCHDDKCKSCGMCEKVCLSGKISMAGGKPVWNKTKLCYMCFACLNFCPAKSVQINDIPGVKSQTRTNDRYPHPYASVGDMLRQKGEAEGDDYLAAASSNCAS